MFLRRDRGGVTHRHRCVHKTHLGVFQPVNTLLFGGTHEMSPLNIRICVHPTQISVANSEHRVCVEFSACQHIWCVQWSWHRSVSAGDQHNVVCWVNSLIYVVQYLCTNTLSVLTQHTRGVDALQWEQLNFSIGHILNVLEHYVCA